MSFVHSRIISVLVSESDDWGLGHEKGDNED